MYDYFIQKFNLLQKSHFYLFICVFNNRGIKGLSLMKATNDNPPVGLCSAFFLFYPAF